MQVSTDPLAALLRRQGGRCAICRQIRKLVVDHDHKTGLVRGLLCITCNTSEGGDIDYPWLVAYRAAPPAAILGLVVEYGKHHPFVRVNVEPRRSGPKPRAATPDYQRIVDDIRSKVRSGELSPGDRLPTKREMAVAYAVSMNTVDRALLILTSEGTIIGYQGKGLFVPEAGDGG